MKRSHSAVWPMSCLENAALLTMCVLVSVTPTNAEVLTIFNGQNYPLHVAVLEGLSRGSDPVLIKDKVPPEIVRAEDAYAARGWWTIRPSALLRVRTTGSSVYVRMNKVGSFNATETPPSAVAPPIQFYVHHLEFASATYPNRQRNVFAHFYIADGIGLRPAFEVNDLTNAGWQLASGFFQVDPRLDVKIGNSWQLITRPFPFSFSCGSAPAVFTNRFTVPAGAMIHDAKYEESQQKYVDSVNWTLLKDTQNRPIGYSVLGTFKPPWHGQTSGGRYRGTLTLTYSQQP